MTDEETSDAEAKAQLARARALTEAAALPLDEERLAALARWLPAPSPLDRYDFGEVEPPTGLRLHAAPAEAPESGAHAE
jgi:hypothetical protein